MNQISFLILLLLFKQSMTSKSFEKSNSAQRLTIEKSILFFSPTPSPSPCSPEALSPVLYLPLSKLPPKSPRGFHGGSGGKEPACNTGDLGLIPGLGRTPGEGNGYTRQYSGLENSMDCTVHRVAKSWTPLRDFHFHFQKKSLTKGQRTYLK